MGGPGQHRATSGWGGASCTLFVLAATCLRRADCDWAPGPRCSLHTRVTMLGAATHVGLALQGVSSEEVGCPGRTQSAVAGRGWSSRAACRVRGPHGDLIPSMAKARAGPVSGDGWWSSWGGGASPRPPHCRPRVCSTTAADAGSASVTSAVARRCRCGACASWTRCGSAPSAPSCPTRRPSSTTSSSKCS